MFKGLQAIKQGIFFKEHLFQGFIWPYYPKILSALYSMMSVQFTLYKFAQNFPSCCDCSTDGMDVPLVPLMPVMW